jgi:hypothetical protein
MRTTISANRQPETVSPHELAQVMKPGVAYSQDAVLDMLPGRPRSCVRETLHLMVSRGQVWRNNQRGAVTFQLLEGDELRNAVDKATTVLEPPVWMRRNLTGYSAEQDRFRSLCMVTRK